MLIPTMVFDEMVMSPLGPALCETALIHIRKYRDNQPIEWRPIKSVLNAMSESDQQAYERIFETPFLADSAQYFSNLRESNHLQADLGTYASEVLKVCNREKTDFH